jgi:inorganic pyrophosphatase
VRLDAMIEIPKGSRNKYEMDPAVGRIRLDRALFTATAYPSDYGFFPDTLAEDGDPLDVLVLIDAPTFPGCMVTVRPVAVFWMRDEQGPDAKVLAVPADDVRFEAITDLPDVPRHLLGEISHFFEVYKDLEPDKDSEARGWQDRAAAEAAITDSIRRARSVADSASQRGPVPPS